MTVDYILPMFRTTPQGLTCGCDMCFSEETQSPDPKIGPHDLHCVCSPCMSFCLDERAYDKAMEERYPGYESFPENLLTQEQIDQLWREVDESFYNSPPTSPTNADMHAYNGNLSHQHHHGVGDFMRTAGHHLSRLSDQNRGKLMMAQAGLFPAGLAYSSFKNLAEPLAELREQIWPHKGPTNKEMHSYNGNPRVEKTKDFSLIPGDGGHIKLPTIPHKDAPNRDQGLHKAKQTPIPKKENKPGRKFQEPHVNHDVHYERQDVPLHPNPGYQQDHIKPVIGSGPTNKEMHMVNGNIKRFGPITKAQHERKQRRKAKKKAKGVTVNIKNTVAKSKPKNFKKMNKAEKLEAKIARAYAKFLRYPSIPPPRLGSTGRCPTKLLHGWYKATFNMASISVGVNNVTNATDFIAFLSPRLTQNYTSPSSFASPIAMGFAQNSTTAFNSGAGGSTNSLFTTDFANVTALLAEAGTTSNSAVPGARWLGGSVSLECRCPMSTTAPPYLFGGLLPDVASNGTIAGVATQLNQLTTTTIRTLASTKEVPGFQITALYIPDSPNALQFNGYTASTNAVSSMPATAIPYIGMSGCPTTATITVYVSSWFEIMQTTANVNYASGWSLGPKCSSEDVFDNLRKVNPVTTKLVNLGTTNANISVASILEAAKIKPPSEDLHHKIDRLTREIYDLKIKIEDEEDEKYVTTSQPDTPINTLSQSTINLALALKDRLTPGSVTSKTSRTSLP